MARGTKRRATDGVIQAPVMFCFDDSVALQRGMADLGWMADLGQRESRGGRGTCGGPRGARAMARAGARAAAVLLGAAALLGAGAQEGPDGFQAAVEAANASFGADTDIDMDVMPLDAPQYKWTPWENPYSASYSEPAMPNGPPARWGWLNSPLAAKPGEFTVEAKLKRSLGINNNTNYDVNTYPFSQMWAAKGQSGENRTGLDIAISINFHRIFVVDQRTGQADLYVWLRQKWFDPRLVWDPENFEGVDQIYAWTDTGASKGEIWTPDIEIWNGLSSPQNSFTKTYAKVKHTGEVQWSRPGRMQVMCNFQGMGSFPFDDLECRIEIGSWRYTLPYIRPVPMDGIGWSTGGSSTAGARYEEFSLSDVRAQYHLYSADEIGFTENDHPVLWYDITLQRAWRPYVLSFVIIQIILNTLAFSVFWLPGGNGGRIGMGITALLTSVTNQLMISQKLPVVQEWTWVAAFSVTSMSFTAASLIESVVVGYFFFCRATDLTPLLFSTCGLDACCGKSRRPCENENGGCDLSSPERHHWHSATWKERPSRKDADDFIDQCEEENNRYWQKVARWVDEFARWTIPAVYVIVIAIQLGTVDFSTHEGLLKPEYEGFEADPAINITKPGQ